MAIFTTRDKQSMLGAVVPFLFVIALLIWLAQYWYVVVPVIVAVVVIVMLVRRSKRSTSHPK